MTVVEDRPMGAETGADLAPARRAMIDSQLRVSGVNDPAILAALAAIPREDFVPAERRAVAYADRAVPLGDGTVLAPALTHGQMLTAAEPVAGAPVEEDEVRAAAVPSAAAPASAAASSQPGGRAADARPPRGSPAGDGAASSRDEALAISFSRVCSSHAQTRASCSSCCCIGPRA